jgi:hypothetical protein
MKFFQKIAVFILASLLTIVGFNLMASSSICLLRLGKEARYEIVANYIHEHNSTPCHLAREKPAQEYAGKDVAAPVFSAGSGSR